MTKTIKFNLTLDNYPVRDLDDLRTHFNIDELLTLYHSKVLHRWLDVRDLQDELKQIMAINSDDNKTIAKTLCQIFHSDLTPADIETAVYPFQFREQQKRELEKLNSLALKRNDVIKAYHAGYEKLINEMIAHAADYSFLKSAINTLWQDYSQLFSVDFDLFFATFIEKSPLTLFAMLGNEFYKETELFEPEIKKNMFDFLSAKNADSKRNNSVIFNENTTGNYKKLATEPVIIKNIINESGRVTILNNHGTTYKANSNLIGQVLKGLLFCSFSEKDSIEFYYINFKPTEPINPPICYFSYYAGITDGYWKDLEPKGKKCLILKMEQGNFIRNAGKNGEELNANDINEKFIILDGIDYKSNNANHTLTYMVI